MKRILFLFLLALPSLGYSQKVDAETVNQTGDLKEFAGEYCTVSFSTSSLNLVRVFTDDKSWLFVDDKNNKKMKFRTSTHILNHMNENGWEFIYAYTDTLVYYIFKRKEKPDGL